jgi:hypothetical protein
MLLRGPFPAPGERERREKVHKQIFNYLATAENMGR